MPSRSPYEPRTPASRRGAGPRINSSTSQYQRVQSGEMEIGLGPESDQCFVKIGGKDISRRVTKVSIEYTLDNLPVVTLTVIPDSVKVYSQYGELVEERDENEGPGLINVPNPFE